MTKRMTQRQTIITCASLYFSGSGAPELTELSLNEWLADQHHSRDVVAKMSWRHFYQAVCRETEREWTRQRWLKALRKTRL